MQFTPLKDEHISLGAKMVDFAGWYMPVEYSAGLRQEHLSVRQRVGLFDVSHMGEIRVQGPKALEAVEWLTTNYVGKLQNGQAQYSLLPNDQGGLVDDLIVYCVEKGHDYLLCVNASNTAKDLAWILAHNPGAEIRDESAKWGQIAVQGPLAMELLARVLGSSVNDIPHFEFRPVPFQGSSLLVARTGYTGEEGAEIFVPTEQTVSLWRALLAKGELLGVQPIGLGARDTLRTEMKYPLYGHEIDATTNPYGAGLGWVIKPDKKKFLGADAIVRGKGSNQMRKLVGLKVLERGIPRQGYKVFSAEGQEVGLITSGTLSPSLDVGIGIAYVEPTYAEVGSPLLVELRGRRLKAEVVPTPFVKRN